MRYPKIPVYKCRLVRDSSVKVLETVAHSHTAASLLRELIAHSPVESIAVIYIDNANRMVGAEVVAMGDTAAVAISVTNIIRGAIIHAVPAIIVGHNHPSGDPTPSHADASFTKHLAKACSAVGISLLDHLVVTHDDYESVGVES